MYKLNENQIKKLLQQAKQALKNGETLSSVFKKTAEKYSMAQGSVRNIYYKAIKEGKGGELKAKKVVAFSEEDASKLLKRALFERKRCSSMREVFLKMANGDKKLALRFQNKYCTMIKNNRSMVMKEIISQKSMLGDCFNPYMNKKIQAERLKLKSEIDLLIKKIAEKCRHENAQLKAKLLKYEKLCMQKNYEEVLLNEDTAQRYFQPVNDNSNKAKAN